MKRIKSIILALALIVAGFVGQTAGAINVFDQCGANPDSSVCKSTGDNATNMVTSVINTLLFILGIIAVIMIIVGGIRYALSSGDSSSTKGAKDTILYAVIGLVVAILAYAIVNFVIGRF